MPGRASGIAEDMGVTSQTDLEILVIDEDHQDGDSAGFLKRRGYDWPDFHYDHDLVSQLGVNAIAATILTDAGGKIIYYHSGAEDMKEVAAAIKSLGEAYRKASVQ